MASPHSAPSFPSLRRRSALPEVRAALTVLLAGVLLGLVWGWSAPTVARGADLGESHVAVDGTLALLGVAAGIATAIGLAVVPGPRPPVRVAVVLVSAVAANLLAAAVGIAGGLHLGATGVALLWPITAAVLTTLRVLAGLVVSPDDDGPRRRRRHDRFSGPPPP